MPLLYNIVEAQSEGELLNMEEFIEIPYADTIDAQLMEIGRAHV